MADVEDRLQAIRTQQQEASRRYAQAEAKLDAVRSQKAALLKGLKEQGFSDVEQARARVIELSTLTEEILEKIESQVSGL